jgi:hypothetical protein
MTSQPEEPLDKIERERRRRLLEREGRDRIIIITTTTMDSSELPYFLFYAVVNVPAKAHSDAFAEAGQDLYEFV